MKSDPGGQTLMTTRRRVGDGGGAEVEIRFQLLLSLRALRGSQDQEGDEETEETAERTGPPAGGDRERLAS